MTEGMTCLSLGASKRDYFLAKVSAGPLELRLQRASDVHICSPVSPSPAAFAGPPGTVEVRSVEEAKRAWLAHLDKASWHTG